jgi:hypothetical protein
LVIVAASQGRPGAGARGDPGALEPPHAYGLEENRAAGLSRLRETDELGLGLRPELYGPTREWKLVSGRDRLPAVAAPRATGGLPRARFASALDGSEVCESPWERLAQLR